MSVFKQWFSLRKPRAEIMDTGKRRGTACRARRENLMIHKWLFQHPHAVPAVAALLLKFPFIHSSQHFPVSLLDNQNICSYNTNPFTMNQNRTRVASRPASFPALFPYQINNTLFSPLFTDSTGTAVYLDCLPTGFDRLKL